MLVRYCGYYFHHTERLNDLLKDTETSRDSDGSLKPSFLLLMVINTFLSFLWRDSTMKI